MQPVQSAEFRRDTSQEIVRNPTNAQSPISTVESEKSRNSDYLELFNSITDDDA